MVSRCCKKPIEVEGHTTHYFVCVGCGRPTDIYHRGLDERIDEEGNNLD